MSQALKSNGNIKFLNLAGNAIKERGLIDFVSLLNRPNCKIEELSLNSNKITSDGISIFAKIIPVNKSLKMLDIGKNDFNDSAF